MGYLSPMLQLAGIAVEAVSVGGLETCIQLPGLDLAFDIGRCPPKAVTRSTLLLTHAHIDHLGGLPMHCATRSMMAMSPPTYLLPRRNVADVQALLDVWRRLDGSELPCTLVGIDPGETHRLGRDLLVQPFRALHVVATNGYVLVRERHKLLPAWMGTPGRELAAAKAAGIEITERILVPEVAFSGDSRIEIVEREEAVRKARLLILELTFLDDRVDVASARGKGHIHFDEVIARAELFENQHILFTHVSSRYSPDEAQAIFAARLPAPLAGRATLLPNLR